MFSGFVHVQGTVLGKKFTFECASYWPPTVMVVCAEMLVPDVVLFFCSLQQVLEIISQKADG